jgi:hypothetical protein
MSFRHLPTTTDPSGGERATCHCDYDLVDERCAALNPGFKRLQYTVTILTDDPIATTQRLVAKLQEVWPPHLLGVWLSEVREHAPVLPATAEDEAQVRRIFGKSSDELAAEAEEGYDVSKFQPWLDPNERKPHA